MCIYLCECVYEVVMHAIVTMVDMVHFFLVLVA